MAGDTAKHVEQAFAVQKVYPFGEVYPGWFAKNDRRAGTGAWHSTGDAARNFHWQMRYTNGRDGFPSEVHMEYFFNYYISFVDYGVGKNRPLHKVQRATDAVRSQRYVDKWVPSEGKTHRPIFRKEMRLLKRRAANWLIQWSGHLYYGRMFRGLEGLTTTRQSGLRGEQGGFTFENLQIK
ncbi:MAG: hypothetical protein IJ557_02415 [Bacteroidaceae bacterium]|nr:hypothetical protein [Bacteroidaceae bacterium]